MVRVAGRESRWPWCNPARRPPGSRHHRV